VGIVLLQKLSFRRLSVRTNSKFAVVVPMLLESATLSVCSCWGWLQIQHRWQNSVISLLCNPFDESAPNCVKKMMMVWWWWWGGGVLSSKSAPTCSLTLWDQFQFQIKDALSELNVQESNEECNHFTVPFLSTCQSVQTCRQSSLKCHPLLSLLCLVTMLQLSFNMWLNNLVTWTSKKR
jgi:hypothetical protein